MGYVIVDTIPDTPEWELERRNSIGASDVPNLLCLPGAYGSPLEVWRSKMGVGKEFDEDLGFIGHALESVMHKWLDWRHPELGPITQGFMARPDGQPWIHATFDRVAGDGAPIQMKSVDYFAGPGWDVEAPLIVQAQVQTEIHVAGTTHGWACAFIGGKRFELYRIERDQQFIDHMLPQVKAFWDNHVVVKRPPNPLSPGEAAWLWPSNHTPLIVTDRELAERVIDLHGIMREWEQEKADVTALQDGAKLELQKAMQECDQIVVNGEVLFSWRARKDGVRVFLRHKTKEA